MQCKRFLVSGRVQGVFYRASTKHQAESLGLLGHARNLANGTVEVIACGDSQVLAVLEQWLWQGPSDAQVTAVDVAQIPPPDSLTGFETF